MNHSFLLLCLEKRLLHWVKILLRNFQRCTLTSVKKLRSITLIFTASISEYTLQLKLSRHEFWSIQIWKIIWNEYFIILLSRDGEVPPLFFVLVWNDLLLSEMGSLSPHFTSYRLGRLSQVVFWLWPKRGTTLFVSPFWKLDNQGFKIFQNENEMLFSTLWSPHLTFTLSVRDANVMVILWVLYL